MLRCPHLLRTTLWLSAPGRRFPPSSRRTIQLLFRCRTQMNTHVRVPCASRMPRSRLELPPPHSPALAGCANLASQKYCLIYAFPAIKGLRVLSRLKIIQTGITVVILPAVGYFYLQGQVSLTLLSYATGVAAFAAIMLCVMSYYIRRVVGMMYLDHTHTTLKVSHLSFWGHRRDVYLPVSDVMTLGDTGDSLGETVLRLKRYSSSDVLYFSTRLGRVVDERGFEKVFGILS
ncbi:transmembrane protein 186 isoform X2 [Electrophorus electricus]|uniref:transmembrane protein 186 isoform X2 n=1 Tax=Electrophorus electricus TaxID=8005 RepID=UPI0015D02EE3|nr:transmembrane protein 186 isoform X2 [Electrophorus electricus]